MPINILEDRDMPTMFSPRPIVFSVHFSILDEFSVRNLFLDGFDGRKVVVLAIDFSLAREPSGM
jgi:hypothetical protein